MKLGVLMMGLAFGSFMLAGCETLGETNGENWARVCHSIDPTVKQIPDDVEMLLMVDKPVRLSEKPVPSH